MARLFLLQSLLILLAICAFGVYGMQTSAGIAVLFAVAAFYGGAMALVNTLLLTRRVRRVMDDALANTPQGDAFTLYIGAVERFVFTLVAMALGMGWLQLNPPVVLATFAVAQLAHPLMAGYRNYGQMQKQSTSELEMGRTS